jgi:Predicted phosphatase/phosphohexomutase
MDVDGTLLDTNYLQVLAWWRAFRDTGHDDVSMAACHRAIGIGSAELVTHLLGDDVPDAAEVMEAKSRRYEPLRELVAAFPRVDELLRACRERGLAVVLATSGEESDLEWMVPAIGGEDVVDGSTTSGDVDSAKPARTCCGPPPRPTGWTPPAPWRSATRSGTSGRPAPRASPSSR